MKKTESRHRIMLEGREIPYILIRKEVKNINVRIKPDGSIRVSANRFVPLSYIEGFLVSKGSFILQTLEKYEYEKEYADRLQQKGRKWTKEEIKTELEDMCRGIYPLFQPYGIVYPIVKIRKMTSRWGSCHPTKGIITLNSKLVQVPKECAEYVIIHEFAHFIHPNHSKDFYRFVERFVPDYKERKKELEKYRNL